MLPNTDPIHKVTIIPRGRALGLTMSLPTEDKYSATKSEMLDQIAMMMGGRVAEEIVFGEMTTGASNDIERATKLAKAMVTRYGMSEKLGPQTFGEANHEVFLGRDFSANADYSQEIAFEIDKEVARMIEQGYEKAREILLIHREQLDLMAVVLLERETVDKKELEALLSGEWEQYLADEAVRKAAAPKEEVADEEAEAPPEEPPADSSDEPPVGPPILEA
jgi:cell division protease FtsH